MKILLIALISGCVSKHRVAGQGFESSNSLCLDAVVVNMDSAGCKSITVERNEDNKLVRVHCGDSRVNGESQWLNFNFYFANTQIVDVTGLPGMPGCVDANLAMSYEPIIQTR
tara:strand:+ start:2052 stop:2390 length:339 start_codon:yes stop_codon:yes gene_type:complete